MQNQECREIWDKIENKKYIIIYGAGNIAKAVYHMLSFFITMKSKCFFCVTQKEKNPEFICGISVVTPDFLSEYYRDSVILLAATEGQDAMRKELSRYTDKETYSCGYQQPLWNFIYEEYVRQLKACFGGGFQTGKPRCSSIAHGNVSVYRIKSHHDKNLDDYSLAPKWLIPLQAGKAMTDKILCELADNRGEHISDKNDRYCELTGLYWIWKNCKDDYKGICHYRRCLDISDKNDILSWNMDVILPFPLITTKSLEEGYWEAHSKEDWDVMIHVLNKLYPDYYQASKTIFQEVVFYPGNIVIAKSKYFDDYCDWLFSILFEVEKKTLPKKDRYQNRYLGFLAERLTTLYFIYNKVKLKIVHTELLMLS